MACLDMQHHARCLPHRAPARRRPHLPDQPAPAALPEPAVRQRARATGRLRITARTGALRGGARPVLGRQARWLAHPPARRPTHTHTHLPPACCACRRCCTAARCRAAGWRRRRAAPHAPGAGRARVQLAAERAGRHRCAAGGAGAAQPLPQVRAGRGCAVLCGCVALRGVCGTTAPWPPATDMAWHVMHAAHAARPPPPPPPPPPCTRAHTHTHTHVRTHTHTYVHTHTNTNTTGRCGACRA
jgi:hypothetical protein